MKGKLGSIQELTEVVIEETTTVTAGWNTYPNYGSLAANMTNSSTPYFDGKMGVRYKQLTIKFSVE